MTFQKQKREGKIIPTVTNTPWFFRGVGSNHQPGMFRFNDYLWRSQIHMVLGQIRHSCELNPTISWNIPVLTINFWANSELHMWNLNGSTSLLKKHIFMSEITRFHSKITIVHGYPSFSSWNHHVSCVPSGFFKLYKSPFFGGWNFGETSIFRRKTTPSWPRTSLRDWERWRASGCDKLY